MENLTLYKDGNDVIIVVKNSSDSFLDIIKKLTGITEVTEIPTLEPVESEKPPVIPVQKEKKQEPVPVPEKKVEKKLEKEPEKPEETLEKVQEEKKPVAEETQPEKEPDPVPEKTGVKCPNCEQVISFNENGVECSCGFSINRVYGKKALSDEDLIALIERGETPIYSDFVGSKGEFTAKLILISKTKGKARFEFINK